MGVRWRYVGVVFLVLVFILSAKEDDTHHIIGVADDALLHQLIGAFQSRGDGAVLLDSFGVGGWRGRSLEHGLTNFDGEDDSVFGAFVGLAVGLVTLF